MNLAYLFLILSTGAFASPTVLVSYFDPYGGAKVNNSETVAKMLLANSRASGLPYEIKLCRVQTKFDVSFNELKNCLNALPEKPIMVLGLGETGCNLKIEIMARNLDKTFGADNAGVERKNTEIVKNAPPAIGLTYPLDEMYCSLDSTEQKNIVISSNAGSFVCNNLMYQNSWFETQYNFGFIHVPDHSCKDIAKTNPVNASKLLTMINRAVEFLGETPGVTRLPVMKTEFERIRNEEINDKCVRSFWKSAKAFDEKRWPF